MNKYIYPIFILLVLGIAYSTPVNAQEPYGIFDDRKILEGYAEKYKTKDKEILFDMIKDENLNAFRAAAAVRIFREKYSTKLISDEKKDAEKILLRALKRTNSPFVQVETMRTLVSIDRYEYYKSVVPVLIQKLDHYNDAVNALAFETLNELVQSGQDRPREARLMFNVLRKVLFLSRKRLEEVIDPDSRLTQKLKLLRWSIKVLGNQELKKLPKEIITLL